MEVQLIAHGGAWDIPDQLDAAHLAGVRQAIDEVYPQLAAGMPALEAVEAAVRILENDPVFDAGRGSFLNAIGEIEPDAMIMDGVSLNFGAVAAVQNLLHPVSMARALPGPASALQMTLENLASRVKGLAGMIAINPQGGYGFALRMPEDLTIAAMRQDDL